MFTSALRPNTVTLRHVLPWFAAIMFMFSTFATPAQAHETLKLEAPKPMLAPTPPIGWNSWNKFACNINEQIVRGQADAMAASGHAVLGRWALAAESGRRRPRVA
jgi:hypothetical protein